MSRTRHQKVGSSNTNRIILYFSKKALTSAFFLLSILSSVKKRWHSLKLSEQLHQIQNMYCFLGIDYTLAPRTILDNSFIEYEKNVGFFSEPYDIYSILSLSSPICKARKFIPRPYHLPTNEDKWKTMKP